MRTHMQVRISSSTSYIPKQTLPRSLAYTYTRKYSYAHINSIRFAVHKYIHSPLPDAQIMYTCMHIFIHTRNCTSVAAHPTYTHPIGVFSGAMPNDTSIQICKLNQSLALCLSLKHTHTQKLTPDQRLNVSLLDTHTHKD